MRGRTKETILGILFILFFVRNLRISYGNFFNVCTHRSEFHLQSTFTVSAEASLHFANSRLQLEFVVVLVPTVTIWRPKLAFLNPWMTHYEDADFCHRRPETQRVWRARTLQQMALHDRYTVIKANLENGCWLWADFVEKEPQFVKGVPWYM